MGNQEWEIKNGKSRHAGDITSNPHFMQHSNKLLTYLAFKSDFVSLTRDFVN
jgi:hypothetical protein